tara:strand:+ start:342 stop:611 length:270 start_codon:yes stop_codon:yes gene_type:complete
MSIVKNNKYDKKYILKELIDKLNKIHEDVCNSNIFSLQEAWVKNGISTSTVRLLINKEKKLSDIKEDIKKAIISNLKRISKDNIDLDFK